MTPRETYLMLVTELIAVGRAAQIWATVDGHDRDAMTTLAIRIGDAIDLATSTTLSTAQLRGIHAEIERHPLVRVAAAHAPGGDR